MKYFLLFLVCFSIGADELPYADETDQLYRCLVPGIGGQKRIGGFYQKVRPPKQLIESQKDLDLYYKKKLADIELSYQQALRDKDQKAIEQEGKSKALAMKWGNRLFFGGLALFVLGILSACVLKHYHVELIGVAIGCVGLAGLSIGAVLIGAVQNYMATVYIVIGLVITVALVSYRHGKGFEIKNPFKSKLKRKLGDA